MLIIEGFDSQKISRAARSTDKDVVCLLPAGVQGDPTAGFAQIDVLYRFAEEPSLAVFKWGDRIFVRRAFLAGAGVVAPTFPEFVRALCKEAERQGAACEL
jgi:hypothetical protein